MIKHISYLKNRHTSNLIIDYLKNHSRIKPFINHFPSLENFRIQISEKKLHKVNRQVLVKILKKQNSFLELSTNSLYNIKKLNSQNTYTVTTGHQLCIFTGPLYFIYKIVSTINLTEKLNAKYPENHFVPVFWMASEDHDFNEINNIQLFGKHIVWHSKQKGPVGRMTLDNFKIVLNELRLLLGQSYNAKKLMNLFENTYLNHSNLSDATRYLINQLFGKYGLLIIDGDDKYLKQQFSFIIKKDILHQGLVSSIRESNNNLAKYYKIQAFVREINFFNLKGNGRELIKDSKNFDSQIIDNNIQEFSPNVLVRPLYQETILPNISYVGGASEISYWMQLKNLFIQENIPFPILNLRNSAILLNDRQIRKCKDLGFDIEDFFLHIHELQSQYILSFKKSNLSLKEEKRKIKDIYDNMLHKFTNQNIHSSIKANLKKHLNSLSSIEEKLIRDEKKIHQLSLDQIVKIKNQLFPNNILQERVDNFIPYYLKHGDNFFEIIKRNFDPLNPNFVCLNF